MIQTLTNNDLIEYLSRQLKNSFPDNIPIENLADIIDKALEKIKYCFNHISLPYYSKDNKTFLII